MSSKDHIERMIRNYTFRLQRLEEQRALQGMSVDPKIDIEIETIKEEIENLHTELRKLEETDVPLPDEKSKFDTYYQDSQQVGNIQGSRIVRLFKSGLDTEVSIEQVDRLYKAAESAMMSGEVDKAIYLCGKALKFLDGASALIPGDPVSVYTRGKCYLLLASVHLNQGYLKLAEKYYIQSKNAFSSKKWFHLEGLSYLGLALTYREMAYFNQIPENLKLAIQACSSAQSSLEQEVIMPEAIRPGGIDILRLKQVVKEETKLMGQLIEDPGNQHDLPRSEEWTATLNDQIATLKVFNLSDGEGLIAAGGTTDLNLLTQDDYNYNLSRSPVGVSIRLLECPEAIRADYIIEIDAKIDRTENGMYIGDWLLIRDEKDDLTELNGKRVVILMREQDQIISGLKIFSHSEDHYFLKAQRRGTNSIVIAPYRAKRLIDISNYYEGFGEIKKRFAYQVQVSGEVIRRIPRTSIKDMTMPIIWRIPILSTISAGIHGTIVEPMVEDYRDFFNEQEHRGADFGVKVVGDSMSGDGINDGDIVLIQQQPNVAENEIAAVVIRTPQKEPVGVLKRYHVYDKRDEMRHWLLKSSNPASEDIVVLPSGIDVNRVKNLYTKQAEAGKIMVPHFYEDARVIVAGKYVGIAEKN